jgi:hypothetical protein
LLKKLGENLGGFSEKRLVERIEEFVEEGREFLESSEFIDQGEELVGGGGVDWLLEAEWPFQWLPDDKQQDLWGKMGSLGHKKRKTTTKRAQNWLYWTKNAEKWKKSALKSQILKGRDVEFVSSLFVLDECLDLLVRIEEEKGSGVRFREATGDKTGTLLFIKSGDNRFGCWRKSNWKEIIPSYSPSCYFFSLNLHTVVESTPNLLDKPVQICPTLGPVEAGSLIRLYRFSKQIRFSKLHQKFKAYSRWCESSFPLPRQL